jgi:hypothetical protein
VDRSEKLTLDLEVGSRILFLEIKIVIRQMIVIMRFIGMAYAGNVYLRNGDIPQTTSRAMQ